MIHQTMSGQAAQARISSKVPFYAAAIAEGQWTLEHAHRVLRSDFENLSLFEIAALAKAIACFQCSEDKP